MPVTFSKLDGDREVKEADVLLDGKRVGWIERHYVDDFISPASMTRRWTFDHVELTLFDFEDSYSYDAAEGYDARSALSAAKAQAKQILSH